MHALAELFPFPELLVSSACRWRDTARPSPARGIADDETVGPMRSRFETVFRPLAGSAGLREFDR
jgi:hypothetical protein